MPNIVYNYQVHILNSLEIVIYMRILIFLMYFYLTALEDNMNRQFLKQIYF